VGLVVGPEVPQVEIEALSELEEQIGRKWPTVVFDQVEVAGRNAKSFGQNGLGEAFAVSERSDLLTVPRISHRMALEVRRVDLQTLQTYRIIVQSHYRSNLLQYNILGSVA
jgi:hypothetical protein